MLHYLVFAVFVVLFMRSYSKATILVAALACLLSVFKDPLNIVGSLYLTLSLVALVIGVFKYGKQLQHAPFLWCIVPVLISYVCTMSVHGFYPKQFFLILAQYCFPCILYCSINNQERIDRFVKYTSGLLLFAIAYSIVEESISANPIMYWCTSVRDKK